MVMLNIPSTSYVLEAWDPTRRRYVELSRWTDYERASIQFHKPYNRRATRRLREVRTQIVLRAKGDRRWP